MKNILVYRIALWMCLVACAPGLSAQRTFVHPGGMHTVEDLERIKQKVLANESPWIEGWNMMIQDSKAQYTYKAAPKKSLAGADGQRQRSTRDATAAYYNILRWYVTGDERYAECAINILNDWSAAVEGPLTGELFQLPARTFVEAAEVARVYPGWKEEDMARFKKMCMESFYPACRDFLGKCGSWSGWDGPANTCNLAIGIFCDNEDVYNEAVEYYRTGKGGGCLTEMINPVTCQVNEMGRDTPHAEIGPGCAAELCLMAWNQGDNLFALEDNLLLKGFEYMCRFNLERTYDRWEWDLSADCADRHFYYPVQTWRRTVGPSFRISDMMMNEIIYNHYVIRCGLEAPYTEAMIRARGLTTPGWEACGYTGISFTLDAMRSPFQAHVLPSSPDSVVAVAGLKEVLLAWQQPKDEVITGSVIERAPSPEGPFTEVGRWTFNTTCMYSDTTVTGGQAYYYRIAEVNGAGRGAYSRVVKATPYVGGALPEGWQLTNFSHTVQGSVDYHASNGHTFIIDGAGSSFGGKEDNVTYVYTKVRNDASMVIRLYNSRSGSDNPGRAGLMMRETLDGDSKMASVALADAGFRNVLFAPRDRKGSSVACWIRGNTHTWLEVWYKLTREGDVFRAYQSHNGRDWYEVGSHTVAMGSDYYAGILVAANNSLRAYFDHLTLTDDLHGPLPALSGLEAAAQNGSRVALKWNPVEGADYYVVSRASEPDGAYRVIEEYCASDAYSDAGLSAQTSYYYKVYAVGMCGQGEAAYVSVRTSGQGVPSVPGGMKALPGDGGAFLSWEASDEATGYKVYRASGSKGEFVELAETAGLSYKDGGLVPGGTYRYKVSAVNAAGESGCSEPATVQSSFALDLRTLASAEIIGTPGSYNNAGNTCDKAMDGNVETFFDANVSSGAYVGLDLGRNTRAVLTRIGYAPRSSHVSRLYGGRFQLSDTPDFRDPVTVYTIDTKEAATHKVTYQDVDYGKAYRYLRYISGDNSSGNIAEAEFWGVPLVLKNQTIDFAGLPEVSVDMGELELHATASSGLPVSYTVVDASVARVEGNKVYLKSVGQTEIHADQAGNDEYGTAERVTRMLNVSLPTAVESVKQSGDIWNAGLRSGGRRIVVSYSGPADSYAYALYSVEGRRLVSGRLDSCIAEIPLESMAFGAYLLKLADGQATEVKKIVRHGM